MVYLILKLIHVVGVIIFLGNITVAPFWKVNAEKTKDRIKLAETWSGIIRADRFFTMPGVIMILVFGIGAAAHLGYNFIETGWIFWSIILFVVTGVVFSTRVSPIQKKILKLVNDEANFNWEDYKKLAKQWDVWGSIATLAPWIAVILMVLKPDL
jgi:uncharacterized membrane protein